MGGFVKYSCLNCGYTEDRIGFGHGRATEPHLQLYRCDKCKTVGSTWVEGEQSPRCASCYDEDITPLEPKNTSFNCPKCDTLAVLVVLEDNWD